MGKSERVHRRRIFRGVLERGACLFTLRPSRGAWTRTIDKDGDIVVDAYDGLALLWANIGDFLIVAGEDIDETALVEVVDLENPYAPKIRFLVGDSRPGAVKILPVKQRKPKKRTATTRTEQKGTSDESQ